MHDVELPVSARTTLAIQSLQTTQQSQHAQHAQLVHQIIRAAQLAAGGTPPLLALQQALRHLPNTPNTPGAPNAPSAPNTPNAPGSSSASKATALAQWVEQRLQQTAQLAQHDRALACRQLRQLDRLARLVWRQVERVRQHPDWPSPQLQEALLAQLPRWPYVPASHSAKHSASRMAAVHGAEPLLSGTAGPAKLQRVGGRRLQLEELEPLAILGFVACAYREPMPASPLASKDVLSQAASDKQEEPEEPEEHEKSAEGDKPDEHDEQAVGIIEADGPTHLPPGWHLVELRPSWSEERHDPPIDSALLEGLSQSDPTRLPPLWPITLDRLVRTCLRDEPVIAISPVSPVSPVSPATQAAAGARAGRAMGEAGEDRQRWHQEQWLRIASIQRQPEFPVLETRPRPPYPQHPHDGRDGSGIQTRGQAIAFAYRLTLEQWQQWAQAQQRLLAHQVLQHESQRGPGGRGGRGSQSHLSVPRPTIPRPSAWSLVLHQLLPDREPPPVVGQWLSSWAHQLASSSTTPQSVIRAVRPDQHAPIDLENLANLADLVEELAPWLRQELFDWLDCTAAAQATHTAHATQTAYADDPGVPDEPTGLAGRLAGLVREELSSFPDFETIEEREALLEELQPALARMARWLVGPVGPAGPAGPVEQGGSTGLQAAREPLVLTPALARRWLWLRRPQGGCFTGPAEAWSELIAFNQLERFEAQLRTGAAGEGGRLAVLLAPTLRSWLDGILGNRTSSGRRHLGLLVDPLEPAGRDTSQPVCGLEAVVTALRRQAHQAHVHGLGQVPHPAWQAAVEHTFARLSSLDFLYGWLAPGLLVLHQLAFGDGGYARFFYGPEELERFLQRGRLRPAGQASLSSKTEQWLRQLGDRGGYGNALKQLFQGQPSEPSGQSGQSEQPMAQTRWTVMRLVRLVRLFEQLIDTILEGQLPSPTLAARAMLTVGFPHPVIELMLSRLPMWQAQRILPGYGWLDPAERQRCRQLGRGLFGSAFAPLSFLELVRLLGQQPLPGERPGLSTRLSLS